MRRKTILDPPSKICAYPPCDVVVWPRTTEGPKEWERHRFCSLSCGRRNSTTSRPQELQTKPCTRPGCTGVIVRDSRQSTTAFRRRKFCSHPCSNEAKRTGPPERRQKVHKPARTSTPPVASTSTHSPTVRPVWRPNAPGWPADGPQVLVPG